MPGTLVPDTYKLLALEDEITNRLAGGTCHLFTNAAVISHATVLGDLVEAAWGGYAAQTLTGWSTPALDGSFHAASTADAVQFPNSSGASQTATGYYYLDAFANLAGVQLYATPIVIPDGLFLQETITRTDQSEF